MIKISCRWNSFRTGLAVGIALPALLFAAFYVVMYSHMSVHEYFEYILLNRTLPKLIGLCVFPNLLIFYFFLNREYWPATKGVIAATLLCTLGIAAIKLFS
ncbi:MAG: hypothetical protein LBS03_05305 [Bacteroidales bacterium]|jgi:hypothetical protein|nr:hypothetical protein [Bacteroidales bacterium]